MEKFLKFLLALAMMLLPLMLKAQDCNETYSQALEIRKTRTVEAQQKAITLFEQARDCFTTQEDIDRCNHQIDLCAKSIRRMGGEPVLTPMTESQLPVQTSEVPDKTEVPDAAEPAEAPTATITFHAAAKDNEPIVIHLESLTGLEIGEKPEWIKVETSDEFNSITIIIDNNSEKAPRRCVLSLKTPALAYSLTIEQAPKKGLF